MGEAEKLHHTLLAQIKALKAALEEAKKSDHERLKMARKLAKSEARYRILADNIPIGIYRRTSGPEGRLVMVNQALVKMFGYASAEELHQVKMATLYYYPEQRMEFSRKLFNHREVIREELKMRKKDGQPIWVAVTVRIIHDDNENPVYFDGIMEDITQRKTAERVAALQQQQLLQADKMASLGILVSGVAHEINNPAQFIVSNLAPLKKIWEDVIPILDGYKEANGDFLLAGQTYTVRRKRIPVMFKNIIEGTDRIKHIVDELRDYAKEQPVDLSAEVDLNLVLKSALALLQNLIKKSTGQFFVTYGKALPQFRGDFRRIEQVIINLVQNACQALSGDDGKISITTVFDETRENLVLQINDTGCGIPKENLGRLTDPFFTTKRSTGGTGLGLSISQTIIFEHRGELLFESEEDQGTTVRLLLPAAPSATQGI